MTPTEILETARDLVGGQRATDHGDFQTVHQAIADHWSLYLGHGVTARDVAMMMVLLKIVRAKCGDAVHMDHYIDIAGYAALAAAIQEIES
jgi:hypothetical protein